MNYRDATSNDIEGISRLHALSWQTAYKDLLSENFLVNEVFEDRYKVWNDRLEAPTPDQFVMVCEESDIVLGFVCMFLGHDEEYGALLDNLHVALDQHRRGIGQQLMKNAMSVLQERNPNSGLYLWVFEENSNAVKFYQRLGGKLADKQLYTGIGESAVPAVRIAWSPESLLANRI